MGVLVLKLMGKAPCVHRDDGGWGSDNNNQLVTQDHLI